MYAVVAGVADRFGHCTVAEGDARAGTTRTRWRMGAARFSDPWLLADFSREKSRGHSPLPALPGPLAAAGSAARFFT